MFFSRYNECYAVYRELLRSTADDLDMERSTNMAAVQVHRTLLKQVNTCYSKFQFFSCILQLL